MPASLANVFLNQDETDPVEAKITGVVPNWISGSYIRVGPGKFDIGDVTVNHFIDGYAMLSKFDIRNGGVLFSKKFLQSEAYKRASEAKKPIFAEFATKGCMENKSFFSRVINALSSSEITDNDSINLFSIEGEIFATSESCHIHNINPTNLSTGKKIDFYKLFGVHMATAHPIKDSNGDLYNIGTSFTTGCKYQILKIPNIGSGNVKDAMKKATVFATIYPSWSTCFSYYHSFAMTENYIVMIEQPLLMNVVKLAEAKMRGKAIRDVMEWTPTEKNRFHIVDKRTGEVLKTKYYSGTPFFYFHFVNSYEENNQIVIDIDAYPNDGVFNEMMISRLRCGSIGKEDPSQVQRFVLPVTKHVKAFTKGENLVTIPNTTATAIRESDCIVLTSQEIGAPGFEGPCTNPLLHYKRHKYIYGSGTCLPGYYANAICKVNTETGETVLWRDQDYFYPGEPEFLASPDCKDEEDGILLSAVSDARDDGQDFLLVIDVKTMKEIGRAIVPVQVPQCIHGQWFPHKSPKKFIAPGSHK